jgi:hypothetical protein
MAVAAKPCLVTVHVRLSARDSEFVCPWAAANVDTLASALPWRTFRWYKGQKHYSGTLWTATERDFVIYESRLELARLLYADFDASVRHIVAQPFLLSATVAGLARKHIPDYLLFTDTVPVVVDVKPAHRAVKPENVVTFAWTKQVVESKGWQYELWTEPPAVELENVKFLAGYRRNWLFDPELLDELRATDLDGATLAQAFESLSGRPRPLVRSAMLHLLWQQHFLVDLTQPLSPAQVLRRAQ